MSTLDLPKGCPAQPDATPALSRLTVFNAFSQAGRRVSVGTNGVLRLLDNKWA
ncbi:MULTISPECIES: hypothetical protein [Pseudomonas]|uniref:hypothetical protein n=1 Tax=Pseudomonas TaxID=286 RepID=UPI0012E91B23|nr:MULTISPECIES: hypothetical protein [Pseudomonas]MBS5839173.1 hypothetical protein [Pseudomonas sp.]MCT8952387.1 hypothetical protein [Pseudomonas lundensis]NNA00208.1 hypothetical protein [Pseudomonas lundensis]NNA16127.1 hypothetical protein [Pseudomonas lundensis]QOF93102.1 hypothetical protein IF654_08185 [Pseudomonas lundensis]